MSKFSRMHPRRSSAALKRRRYRWFVSYARVSMLVLFYLSSLAYTFRAHTGIEITTDLPMTERPKHKISPPRRDEATWITQNWEKHVHSLQEWARTNSEGVTLTKPITAFLEPPLNASIPGSGNQTANIPPQYYQPLPLRTQSPQTLRKVVYRPVVSCNSMPGLLPTDRGRQVDPTTGNVQIIAQNKRRCKTGEGYGPDLERLEPQVALFQSVSVQRLLSTEQARQLAPELWQSKGTSEAVRYRLVPYDQADVNATRFICKFHTWSPTSTRIDLGETLSEYPFNYEMASVRKKMRHPGLLSHNGKGDNHKYWTSTLMFSCPTPKGVLYYKSHPQSDVPVLYVDIVPIRTPPRFPTTTSTKDDKEDAGFYLHPDWVSEEHIGRFDTRQAWGFRHVLPEIEASGRWENIPVCPLEDSRAITPSKDTIGSGDHQTPKDKKPHLLSACLWAAASFRTRGESAELTSDTKTRLMEWIDFHLLVGFDHIYVYDNSAAYTNETNLSEITGMYKPEQVTRIEWPFVVCNNNGAAHDNPGERSSQYAAENSCRTRFSHRTEWIASIDTDEYLVPMGEHTSLRTVVENAKDTNILSFRSTRGKLRYTASQPGKQNGRQMNKHVTFLEAYNCDSAEAPKPGKADRARKQLYRADHVLNRFVHYSTVTKAYTTTYKENPKGWTRWITGNKERVVDELNEATMIHTKTVDLGDTRNYKNRCNVEFRKKQRGCYVGFPWPNNKKIDGLNQTDGTQYNCFINKKVENYWLPLLRKTMAQHSAS